MFPSSKLFEFSVFTRMSSVMFQTVGIEPYRSNQVHGRVYQFFQSLIFHLGTWNIVLCLLGEMVILPKIFNDFLKITAVAPCIVFCMKVLGKILTILHNRDRMTSCMTELEMVFPKSRPEQKKIRMDKYERHIVTVIRPFSYLSLFTVSVFSVYELCFAFYEYYLGSGVFIRQLPFLIWYPFTIESNWVYAAVYLQQSYASYVSMAVLVAIDSLLCTIMAQIIMHFDNVSNQLVEMKITGTCEDTKRLQCLIEYHIRVLRISEDFKQLFNISIFLNFVSSTFTICLAGFQVAAGASLGDLIKYFAFLTYDIVNIFIICYHGTNMIEASLAVSQAAYNQEWFEADRNYKRNLLFVLTRAQKPAVMNATNLADVSLQSFNKIMSTSYQFFALLRTVYTE